MSNSLVISGCRMLPGGDGALGDPVEIVIRDGLIETIAAYPEPPPDGLAVIDGRGLIALPGLINAHTHSPENPLRGLGEGLALEPWLALMFTTAGPYTPEDHYACALAGAVEMLRGGTTAVVDHLWMTPPTLEAIDAVMSAYRDAGIRAAVAPLMDDIDTTEDLARIHEVPVQVPLFPRPRPMLPAGELAAMLEETVHRWHGAEDGRLRVLAGPGGIQWCSDDLLVELARVAERHRTSVHIHALETWLQDRACRLRFGTSGIAGLDDLGILAHCSLAHGVWLDGEDLELIAQRGAMVVHNPAANLRLGSGRAPVRELLDAGVPVALGTDGAASSDNQLMWDQLKLAALIHNDIAERWVTSADALRMATEGGAAVLGCPGMLGALAPGMLADLTLLDASGEGLAGAVALSGALALSETGRAVRHVIVAGEVVVRDGHCTLVDERAARLALAEQAARRSWRARGAADVPAVVQLQRLRAALRPALGVETQSTQGGSNT